MKILILDAQILIEHCRLGDIKKVHSLLATCSFVPQIYAFNNLCLQVAHDQGNSELIRLLCQYVPQIDYFESSAKTWAQNKELLQIIEEEKTRRFFLSLNSGLKAKAGIKSIKI